MSLKMISRGSHQQFLNGKKIANKLYDVYVDTSKQKSKQVSAHVSDNNLQYNLHDSLEHFLKKMSSNNSSLFNLLKQEKQLSKLKQTDVKKKFTRKMIKKTTKPKNKTRKAANVRKKI